MDVGSPSGTHGQPIGWLREPRTRRRWNPGASRHSETTQSWGVSPRESADFTVGGTEITRDGTQPKWRDTPQHFADKGGSFHSVKSWITQYDVEDLSSASNSYGWKYAFSGPLFPSEEIAALVRYQNWPDNYPAPWIADMTSGLSDNEIRVLGSTAIARTIPTAPSVSIAQTLGELKEGLPNLAGKSLRRGDLGGEYLNFTFGISPIIADVEAYAETYRNAEKILSQWRRDSGRHVRRRYTFPETRKISKKVTKDTIPSGTFSAPHAYLTDLGELTVTTTTSRKTWFSGAYKYFIPAEVEGFRRKLQDFDRLYGLYPNAQTAWELMPWSWFVDWNTNFGDVVKNVSELSGDDLVLLYGYLMAHSQVKREYSWTGYLLHGGAWRLQTLRATVINDVKQRVPASPYGLGWSLDGYSPKQWSILAALSIAKR